MSKRQVDFIPCPIATPYVWAQWLCPNDRGKSNANGDIFPEGLTREWYANARHFNKPAQLVTALREYDAVFDPKGNNETDS